MNLLIVTQRFPFTPVGAVLGLVGLLWAGPAEAACGGSSPTWTAASASYTDVNACVTGAADGDIINVPSGSATWSTTLKISKNIQLIGAGIDKTVVTGPTSTYIITYLPGVAQAGA